MTIRNASTSLIAVLAITAFVTPVLAGTVPCEDMLKDLRAAVASAKPSEADAKKVADLEAKGIERCNADDDKRADTFFSDAMKLLGK